MSYDSYQVQPLDLSVKSSATTAATDDIESPLSRHKSAVFHHSIAAAAAAAAAAAHPPPSSPTPPPMVISVADVPLSLAVRRRLSESSDYGGGGGDGGGGDCSPDIAAGSGGPPRKRYLSKYLNNPSGNIIFLAQLNKLRGGGSLKANYNLVSNVEFEVYFIQFIVSIL